MEVEVADCEYPAVLRGSHQNSNPFEDNQAVFVYLKGTRLMFAIIGHQGTLLKVNTFLLGCRGTLHLSPSQETVALFQNDSFIVTCHGEGAEGTIWRGPGNKLVPPKEGRIHTEERDGGAISLVFENILKTDKGVYMCTSKIKDKEVNVTFNMIVVKPIKFISGLALQNLTIHQNGIIRCEATGEPKPTMIWKINGKSVQGSRYAVRDNGLWIMNVTKEDEGAYLCQALQVTPQTSTFRDQLITVEVHHKPHLKKKQLGWFGYIGGIANLTCEVDAKPPADFTWARIGQTLDNPRIITEPNRSVLQVNVTDKSVFGQYECKAWNSVGSITRVEDLKEGTKPNPPEEVIFEHSDSPDQIKLRIKWSNKDQDPLGVRVEVQEHSGSDGVTIQPEYHDLYIEDGPLTLKDLKSNTGYTFRVATLGSAGLSDFTSELKFTTSSATSTISSLILTSFSIILFSFVMS